MKKKTKNISENSILKSGLFNYNNILYIFIFLLIIFFSFSPSFSQNRIGKITIDQREVFDSTADDRYFFSDIANNMHTLTRQYIIEDELLFKTDDELDMNLIEETERNLRRLGIFTKVFITLDSSGYDKYDVTVHVQDKWSTMVAVLLGTGGGQAYYGLRLAEKNFIGTGTYLDIGGIKRTENDIGFQGQTRFQKSRLFRTEATLDLGLSANRFKTVEQLNVSVPYRTLITPNSYGIFATNGFGSDFSYRNATPANPYTLIEYKEQRVSGYWSKAWIENARQFFTAYIELEKVNRGLPEYVRAFDNTGKFLLQFSSISEDYSKIEKINTYLPEDFMVGGYGSAILGKTFAIGNKGEEIYYIAAQGERSYLKNRTYLYGQITGSSGFQRNVAKFTYQEFYGLGFYRFSESLLLAIRTREINTWNWNAFRQLILDNDGGLRGYELNRFSGDNRILTNIEMRFFPDWEQWFFKFSGVAFYDIGTTWNRGQALSNTRFYSSAGLGLRFHNMKDSGRNSIIRIDFAYNFADKKFGGIIISTDQLFSAFSMHNFKLPQIFGLEFDGE